MVDTGTISATTTRCAVRAVHLGKWIDDRAILQDVNFTIAAGEYVALLGANGAGKSTLLKILATLVPPSDGELQLFEEASKRDAAGVRARIGLIGHQPMLYGDLTARENLEFFGKLYGVKEAGRRAVQLLETVGLKHRAHDPVKTFSRGMTQRIAISRALMHDPQLILADEPFAGLDTPSIQTLEKLLAMLHAQGRTIILVNHDIAQSLRLAQRVVILRSGRIRADFATSELTPEKALAEVCGS